MNYELSVQITSQYKYSLESITDTIGVSAFPNTIKTINEMNTVQEHHPLSIG